MDTAKCKVVLGGDLQHTVVKEGVTPMEMVILRYAQESDHAVEILELTGSKKTTPQKEWRRLEQLYNVKFVEEAFPSGKNMPKFLPTKFEEVVIDLADSDDDQEDSAEGRKKRSRAPKELVAA